MIKITNPKGMIVMIKLKALPDEVKTVIEEKIKSLPLAKKPIIMPSTTNQQSIEVLGAKVNSKVNVPSFKPIEVRFLRDSACTTDTPKESPRAQLQPKIWTPKPSNPQQNTGPLPLGFKYPAGIPRTFLKSLFIPPSEMQQLPTYSQQLPQSQYLPQAQHQQPLPVFSNTPPAVPGGWPPPPPYLHADMSPAPGPIQQPYSPSDEYSDVHAAHNAPHVNEPPSPVETWEDSTPGGSKRPSAFDRLGPLEPFTDIKKPKLTINIMYNKEQAIREVVDETEKEKLKKYIPAPSCQEVLESKNETVVKYRDVWPWKKPVSVKKTVSFRQSKSVMLLEQEQMEEVYEREDVFVLVSVTGYPQSWRKEEVLDVILDAVKGKTFIPCFIEFAERQCKFLLVKNLFSLLAIHKLGFIIRHEDVELHLSISQTELTLEILNFVPKTVIKNLVAAGYDDEKILSLREFTLKPDINHFIYFPLRRISNQTLLQLQSEVAWDYLTELDLSHNRLTSIDGFHLWSTTPKLQRLDLSHNSLERVTVLLNCRALPLRSLRLEGNPLCCDYTDPAQYVRVLRMMFSTLQEIDDVPIHLRGEMPKFYKNYCPDYGSKVVDKFLQVYFPLLDSEPKEREDMAGLYDKDATLTITYREKLRFSSIYMDFRPLFLRSRVLEEGQLDAIQGASTIAGHMCKWPSLIHDPFTFTVDLLHHDDSTSIIRIGGIVKVISEKLVDDEHLLAFSRSVVLNRQDSSEYKIHNELVCWDEPVGEYASTAFRVTRIKTKKLSLKLESDPDDYLKEKLTLIFMKLTELDETRSARCLEKKKWNLKNALELFIKLLKLNDLDSLKEEN